MSIEPEAFELAEIEASEPEACEAGLYEFDNDPGKYGDHVLQSYLRDLQRHPLLTPDEERLLAARVELGDQAARGVMIVSNLRLVVKMAKRYQNRGMSFLDLVGEGNIGLIKAVDRFKLEKECRFSTYATWWIRQSIERALDNQSRTVRLPVHVAEEMGKMARATKNLKHELSRKPTAQELADQIHVELPRVHDLMTYLQRTYSLDQQLAHASGEFTLGDLIEDTESVPQEEMLENLSAYELAVESWEELTRTEQKVLTRRFGLEDTPPETLEAIGNSLRVTRERVRQIELGALKKLRRLMEQRTDGLAGSEMCFSAQNG